MDKRTKGQEEMIGFALIIVIVAVILLIFLGFSLNKQPKENLQSNEVESFLNAILSYTTECRDERNFEFLPIRKLIIDCSQGLSCYDGSNTCETLENDLKKISEKSWDLTRYNGYEMKILSQDETLIPIISQGNLTGNSKGYLEEVNNIVVLFKVYY
ncbi:MAG: hypothetical protein WC584_01910 [Candidatus Pacearchaeota archaeon]